MTRGIPFVDELRSELVAAAERQITRYRRRCWYWFIPRRDWIAVARNLANGEILHESPKAFRWSAIQYAHRMNEMAVKTWQGVGLPPMYLYQAEPWPARKIDPDYGFILRYQKATTSDASSSTSPDEVRLEPSRDEPMELPPNEEPS